WLGTRLVDHERPAFHLLLVELADRLLRFVVGAHLHEREAASPAGRHVAHHANTLDLAGAAEHFGELILGRGVRKVADVQSPAHAVTYSCQTARDCLTGVSSRAAGPPPIRKLARMAVRKDDPTSAGKERALIWSRV